MLLRECENPVRSLWERGSEITEMGTIGEVAGWLFPEVPEETKTVLEALVQALGSIMPSTDQGNGVFVLRGSSGHRIVNRSLTGEEKPPGFDTAEHVWRGLIEDPCIGIEDCEEARILAYSRPDLDLVVETSVDLERFAAKIQIWPELEVRSFVFAGVPIVKAQADGVKIEIHHLPDTTRLAEDDHRVSMSLPVCEAFSVAFIRSDGTVYVDAFSQSMLSSDRVSTSFGNVHQTQAIVGAQRALSTHHLYRYTPMPELAADYRQIGQPLSYYLDDLRFWEQSRDRTPSGTVEQRQAEMVFGFMRLLTQDPTFLTRYRPLFNQTLIGAHLDPDYSIVYDRDLYQRAFRNCTLKPEESGVALLARQLDLSIMEVIRGLRVSE